MSDNQLEIRVEIICDSSADVGLGHVNRMIFLGTELNKYRRLNCSLTILSSVELLGNRLNQLSYQYNFGTVEEVVDDVIHKRYPNFLIYDLSLARIAEVNPVFFERIRRMGVTQIGIDNLIRFSQCTDFTLVPAFRINSKCGHHINTKVKWGWNSYLLPLPQDVQPTQNNKLLVLTGSSDIAGLGNILPGLLDEQLLSGMEINWVQGPLAKPPVLPENPRHHWNIHIAPNGLGRLMRECSYGLSVYGLSLFELVSYQVPSVALSPYGEKDDEDMRVLEDLGIALYGTNAEHAVQRINDLVAKRELFQSIQRSSKDLIKNTGTEIISDFIFSTVSSLRNS